MANSTITKSFNPIKTSVNLPTSNGTTYETMFSIRTTEATAIFVRQAWYDGRPTGVRIVGTNDTVLAVSESTTESSLCVNCVVPSTTQYGDIKVQAKIVNSTGVKHCDIVII